MSNLRAYSDLVVQLCLNDEIVGGRQEKEKIKSLLCGFIIV